MLNDIEYDHAVMLAVTLTAALQLVLQTVDKNIPVTQEYVDSLRSIVNDSKELLGIDA